MAPLSAFVTVPHIQLTKVPMYPAYGPSFWSRKNTGRRGGGIEDGLTWARNHVKRAVIVVAILTASASSEERVAMTGGGRYLTQR